MTVKHKDRNTDLTSKNRANEKEIVKLHAKID